MKKFFSLFLALTLVFCFCISAVSCNKEEKKPAPNSDQYDEYKAMSLVKPEGIGGDYVALSSDMSAIEMFNTANANEDKVDWLAYVSVGSADTEVKVLKGKISLIQSVFTQKIIDNSDDGYFYATTSSITSDTDVSLIEMLNLCFVKSYYRDNATGKHYFVEGENGEYNEAGLVDSTQFKNLKTYDTEQELVDDGNANNPFIWGVYDVSEDTLLKPAEATHNDQEGYWTVKLELDVSLATEQYEKVMKEMMGKFATITFNYCNIEYQIWDNGLLKESSISEGYDMVVGLKVKVENSSTTYYTYDTSKFDINDYRGRFGL